MTTTLLTTTAILLAILLAGAIGQIAHMARDLHDRDWELRNLQDALDDANDELAELRSEYERSLGGERYKFRPVNRVFGRRAK
jgi:hypothetical protein